MITENNKTKGRKFSAAEDKTSISNIDAANHVTGKSIYVDDIPVMEAMLFVKVFDSRVAHGKIKS
ncbi:MAG: hypothetical protein WBP16_04740, partial [Ferruginibacter sp.]